jgi:hypothetical protein
MSTALKLLADIERFLADHDMAATTFGVLSVADRHQVERLRKGGDLTTERYDRVVKFMREFDSSKVKIPKKAPWKRKKRSKHKAEATAA